MSYRLDWTHNSQGGATVEVIRGGLVFELCDVSVDTAIKMVEGHNTHDQHLARIAELEAGFKELLEWAQSMTSSEYQSEIDKYEQLLTQSNP